MYYCNTSVRLVAIYKKLYREDLWEFMTNLFDTFMKYRDIRHLLLRLHAQTT